MDKVDFKKKYKDIYSPSKKTPSIVTVPKFSFISIQGEGAPSSAIFSDSIGAIYSLAYTIRMSYKGDFVIPNFYEYVVPPLEGVWGIKDGIKYEKTNKNNLVWQIGIMQPDFVTKEILIEAKKRAILKKDDNLINDIELIDVDDGLCCTYLHIGSYDTEDISFDVMHTFAKENGYKRIQKTHREIYLNDFSRTPVDKLKTVLRFTIAKC